MSDGKTDQCDRCPKCRAVLTDIEGEWLTNHSLDDEFVFECENCGASLNVDVRYDVEYTVSVRGAE